MSYYADKRKEHEKACEDATRQKNYSSAKFHAGKTASFSLKMAKQTDGKVAERLVEDAFEWIEIAEELAKHKDELTTHTICKAEGIVAENTETQNQGQWIVTERPEVSLDDIAGMEDMKRLIKDMLLDPLRNPETAQKWGLASRNGVLLYGPPGCGKTTFAKAIAHEMDCPFFTATGADIRSKWSGEAEKQLQRLFREAKANPSCIIFIDDIDGLLPRRGGQSVVDTRLVCQFLAEIGGCPVSEQNTERLKN